MLVIPCFIDENGELACLEMVDACAKSYYMYKVNSASWKLVKKELKCA